jgi:3-oxoacyl-[acyl-carrier-protein] synthase-3
MARYARISGWGKALPQRVLTNLELEQMVDTTDEWIRTRTGIRERRIAGPKESTLTLALRAAREAMEVADLAPHRLDLIIVCTFSPEFGGMPSTASLVQDGLGADRAGAFDLNAACSGFIYGLAMAHASIACGMCDHALVIGAETLSRLLDWKDRATCVLFGDGAGAVVLQATSEPTGVLSYVLGSDGSGGDLLSIPAGGSRHPASLQTVQTGQHFIRMNGKEVYRFAVTTLPRATREAVQRAGLSLDEIDLLIPHQANIRIIQAAAAALGIPRDKLFINVDRYGNTSAASIPIALCEAVEQGLVRQGSKLVLAGFGAGLSWGAAVLEWAVPAPVVPSGGVALLHTLRDRVAGTRSLVRRAARHVDSLLSGPRWNGGTDPRTGNSLDAPPPSPDGKAGPPLRSPQTTRDADD